MNTKHLFAAAALAVIGTAATAQEATPDTWQQVRSTMTVEQVRAELAKAPKVNANTWTQVPATKTVEQVRIELAQARKDGSLEALVGEAGNHAFAATGVPTPVLAAAPPVLAKTR